MTDDLVKRLRNYAQIAHAAAAWGFAGEGEVMNRAADRIEALERDYAEACNEAADCYLKQCVSDTRLAKAVEALRAERDAHRKLESAAQGLSEVLDQHETKGPLPDTALMFCWLAAQNVRAVLRGYMLEKPE